MFQRGRIGRRRYKDTCQTVLETGSSVQNNKTKLTSSCRKRQRSVLSPYLFNVLKEAIFRKLDKSTCISIKWISTRNLSYADDTTFLADIGVRLQNIPLKVDEAGKGYGVKNDINETYSYNQRVYYATNLNRIRWTVSGKVSRF